MVEHEEIPLAGGNISAVVRVGETVRRVIHPWSPAVHGLLRHLAARGIGGCPRFLGIDAYGREILSYIPGEVGAYPLRPYMWSDTTLTEIALLVRRLHDATVDFTAAGAPWQFIYPDATRHEVICHNDIAPYNTVFVGERPHALIDFDTAGPGPRIWDIAYAAYRFIPLGRDAPLPDGKIVPYDSIDHALERRRRVQLLVRTYGHDIGTKLIETVERRLQAMCSLLVERAAAGDIAYQRLIDEGHLSHYLDEIDFIRRYGADWQVDT